MNPLNIPMLHSFSKKIIHFLVGILLILATLNSLNAQGWEKTYGSPHWENSQAVVLNEDGGFTFIGTTDALLHGDGFLGQGIFNIYVVRTDVDGTVMWQRTYGGMDTNVGIDILRTTDGGYLILGHTNSEGNGQTDIIVIQIDSQGNPIWSKTYGGARTETATHLLAGTNNEYYIIGESNSETDETAIFITKITAAGEEIWSNPYGSEGAEIVGKAAINDAEELFITGQTFDVNAVGNLFLLKIDDTGEQKWLTTYDLEGLAMGNDIIVTQDNTLAITGSVSNNTDNLWNQAFLIKTNTDGDVLWSEVYNDMLSHVGVAIQELPDSNLLIAGNSALYSDNQDIFLLKTNPTGMRLWEQSYGGSQGESCSDLALSQSQTPVILGNTFSIDAGRGDISLAYADSNGHTLQHHITGNVIFDSFPNCQFDSSEIGLSQWLVSAANIHTNRLFYGTTDGSGAYDIPVDTGTYQLFLHRPNNYWQTCQDSQFLTFVEEYRLNVDFLVQAERLCPLLEVDISTPRLRPGYTNTYHVRYRNQGTYPAESATVEITLDPLLSPENFDIPPIGQQDLTYTFDIGAVDINEEGRFQIQTTLDTFAYLGQTHCTEAHILPDSLCLPIDTTLWDGSSIEVEGDCEADSVKFLIKNVGFGDMDGELQYFVIQDDIIVLFGTFDVDAGQDTLIGFPANGQTYHLRAEQSPGHPGISTPNATVEGCAGDGGTAISLGFVTQFPEDDGDPFISIDCQPNVNSFDPNDKQGFPKGAGEDGCIAPNTDIEYLIRFQNTGTDTAFLVVIRDTIPEGLDITTLQTGASSHAYDMEIYGNGIVKFTFQDIMLPDSNVNEAASHGFVKFRIAQQKDNPVGTTIKNSAGIYFDFNAPIITNLTSHRIDTSCFEVRTNTQEVVADFETLPIKVYPNPSNGQITFEVLHNISSRYELQVFDLAGKSVYQQQFSDDIFHWDKSNLPVGMYVFKIKSIDNQYFFGKIIFQ